MKWFKYFGKIEVNYLRFSQNSAYLIFFVNGANEDKSSKQKVSTETIEYLYVLETSGWEKCGTIDLDLHDKPKYREDPWKLFHIMSDNTSLLLRDKTYKGVTLYNLDECEEMSSYPNICAKAILDLKVLKDNTTLCIGSEDKKLRFFDLSAGTTIATLHGHIMKIN